jgi:stalled ribosome rescue protein Dom34
MKSPIRGVQVGQEGTLAVIIRSSSDYPVLAALIQPRDEITTLIRIKETVKTAPKKTVLYFEATVTVERIMADPEAIQITGPYRVAETGKHGRTSVWLVDGAELLLRKKCWRAEDIEALRSRNESQRAPAGSAAAEDRAMDELRVRLATDPEMLAFGGPGVLYALEHGAMKTLLITQFALAKLTKDRQALLREPSGRVRGAAVVILRKESKHNAEIQAFGGVVGILKYRFEPDECLTDV